MPIYEYECKGCKAKFEKIRPMKDADTSIHCTKCGSMDTRRMISCCNSKSSGDQSHTGSSGCSGCSGGSCASCGH